MKKQVQVQVVVGTDSAVFFTESLVGNSAFTCNAANKKGRPSFVSPRGFVLNVYL